MRAEAACDDETVTGVILMPIIELLADVTAAEDKGAAFEFAEEAFKRLFGISSSISLSGSLISALIRCVACLVDSVPPLQKLKKVN